MIRKIIPLLIALPCFAAEVKDDMLRFENGDQLHGTFSGIATGSSVMWKRTDISAPVDFKFSEIRQIVLRGGRPGRSLTSLSHIGLVNGDRIPGTIQDLDDKKVTIGTEFAGTLEFPRDQVGIIAPSPLGGRVLYQGPFDESEWSNISYEYPDGIPEPKKNAKKEDIIPQWNFAGSAWYWQNEKIGSALVRKSGIPDRAIIQFDLAWKNRLSMAIAFHADFARPKLDKDGEDQRKQAAQSGQPASLPGLFGNSYVIHLFANYVRLFRTSYDSEGNPLMEPVQTSNGNMRLGESGNAKIDLRCNRNTGEIVLFIDGEFVAQWSELNLGEGGGEALGYAGKGDGFGFVVQGESSPARISEIVVAEWNGMPDAARSLQVEEADIVLLSNGTDRFSGKITGIHEGKLTLEGRYGDFTFPMKEIAEVRFAKSRLAKKVELADRVKVRFYPIGRISGQALGGDAGSLKLLNPAAGEIDVKLAPATMIEFRSSDSFLDDWETDF